MAVIHLCDICGRRLHDYTVAQNGDGYFATKPQYTRWLNMSEPGGKHIYIRGELIGDSVSINNLEICTPCAKAIKDYIKVLGSKKNE